jgi:GxxExxY protein
MHENEISEKIIGAAIEVHRILGPGLLESVYEDALCHELHLRDYNLKDDRVCQFRIKESNSAQTFA